MNELHGAGVALVTPFNSDESVDFEALGQLIDLQINEGMDYLVSLGTTGEVATLTNDERKRIWDFTVKRVNGRLPLVAGIGGNNTAEIVEQIKNFDPTGFCAILSVSPYYNKPTQEGIYQHYKAVASASPLPVILYNVPGRTGSNITAQTTLRLANDFSNIVAIKEASGNFAQFSEILRDKPAEFLLISGDDPVTLPMMSLGAAGIISVIGNALPKKVATLAKLCAEGNYAEARSIHNELLNITDLCFIEGNPAGVKYILQELGIGKDQLRLPLVPISEKIQAAIKEELKKLN
ncbi:MULTISPECIES: 4-hydroxy-tetrahydrodipicolinate synthase [Sphingobacterium]|jgi:4-hydroxy-tetrahydrodipicolinate synthase|uniref:4-hydroxy-tetrahydrodipicolinate synthase n=1 Tax=Sphingobacterium multivorum TaxID=28454 RepID=A0A653Z122_SPHMU|nr:MULTISPECIES: 4-hydroxy-tetrahydrodipicolinate synthase [Sphingobacterium]HAE66328.1 4-hydroxy-tetrahydrodipicolinate synthase [Sphingobacterium sp.]OFV13656.1 4-hydroxy-tetrahydrodipicolinate synthase [Sphingobacterium sp. HMSC13C05]QQT47310.1 4-hydroxy-tetrahydrodipicolinate synthase [Sphingobacterium multivorum]QQT60182.1 4-hydroxy-tetrahydrodipicolinate synthase [Sphingobacterium multivorum]SUJ04244.1 Dihydrodipicolinate synthase [Sphingobacterium multivorum]